MAPLPLDTRREKKGVSLRKLSRDLGIPYATTYFHHRKNVVPSLSHALLYARYYGCSPEAILKGFTATKGERT